MLVKEPWFADSLGFPQARFLLNIPFRINIRFEHDEEVPGRTSRIRRQLSDFTLGASLMEGPQVPCQSVLLA